MELKKRNIYDKVVMPADGSEFSEILLHPQNCKIERIISRGQSTAMGHWYDEADDEWVILLQGEAQLEFADSGTINLLPGDYVWIPSHQLHRVNKTSVSPECIWLALHLR